MYVIMVCHSVLCVNVRSVVQSVVYNDLGSCDPYGAGICWYTPFISEGCQRRITSEIHVCTAAPPLHVVPELYSAI